MKDCWIWEGLIRTDGYGQLRIGGKAVLAHRISYSLYKGAISPEWHVLHSCDNPPCINPNHLRLGTNAENVADRLARGRPNLCYNQARGERQHLAKLTAPSVQELRQMYSTGAWTTHQLGPLFGISQTAAAAAIARRTWAHVE